MAITMTSTRNAPLQPQTSSKTISAPNSAVHSSTTSQRMPSKTVAAPAAPAPPPPATGAIRKINGAGRPVFSPNMLQNVRSNLKKATDVRSRETSLEPPNHEQHQGGRSRAMSPALQPTPDLRSRQTSPEEVQQPKRREIPLREALRNGTPAPLLARRAFEPSPAPSSAANRAAAIEMPAKIYAQMAATLKLVGATDGKIKLITDEQVKLANSQSSIMQEIKELHAAEKTRDINDQAAQAEMMKSINALERQYTTLVEQSNRTNEQVAALQRDMNAHFSTMGIKLEGVQSAANARPSILPADNLALEAKVDQILVFLQAQSQAAAVAPPAYASPTGGSVCQASSSYEAGMKQLLEHFDGFTTLRSDLSSLISLPDTLSSQLKATLVPMETLMVSNQKSTDAAHKQQELQFSYFTKQGDAKSAVEALQAEMQRLHEEDAKAAEASYKEAVELSNKRHEELLKALKPAAEPAITLTNTTQHTAPSSTALAGSLQTIQSRPLLLRGTHPAIGFSALQILPKEQHNQFLQLSPSQQLSYSMQVFQSLSQTQQAQIQNRPQLRQAEQSAPMAQQMTLYDQGSRQVDSQQAMSGPTEKLPTARPPAARPQPIDSGSAAVPSLADQHTKKTVNEPRVAVKAVPTMNATIDRLPTARTAAITSSATAAVKPTSIVTVERFTPSTRVPAAAPLPTLPSTSSTTGNVRMVPTPAAAIPAVIKSAAPSAPSAAQAKAAVKPHMALTQIAAMSQDDITESDSSAMDVDVNKFSCLQASASAARIASRPCHPKLATLSPSEDSNSSTDSSPSRSSIEKPIRVHSKPTKLAYTNTTSKRRIIQSEEETQAAPPPAPRQPLRTDVRTLNQYKEPQPAVSLAAAASRVVLEREASLRVAHSSDTDYSDPVSLKAPPVNPRKRKSSSPLTPLESEASSRPPSKSPAKKPKSLPRSGSPEIEIPPTRILRNRRGTAGSPPPVRRAAPRRLRPGSANASTEADDSNDLDYDAGGKKGKAAAAPKKKKQKR